MPDPQPISYFYGTISGGGFTGSSGIFNKLVTFNQGINGQVAGGPFNPIMDYGISP